jgi:hypothetical protein
MTRARDQQAAAAFALQTYQDRRQDRMGHFSKEMQKRKHEQTALLRFVIFPRAHIIVESHTDNHLSRVSMKDGDHIKSLPTPVIEKIVKHNNYIAKWIRSLNLARSTRRAMQHRLGTQQWQYRPEMQGESAMEVHQGNHKASRTWCCLRA